MQNAIFTSDINPTNPFSIGLELLSLQGPNTNGPMPRNNGPEIKHD